MITLGRSPCVCVAPTGPAISVRCRTWILLNEEVLLFSEFLLGCHQAEQFSPGTVLEQKVQLLLVLEAHLQLHEEGVFDGREDLFFGHYVPLLVLFEDVFFLEDFQRVELFVLKVAHQEHLGIGALADHRNGYKIFEVCVSIHQKLSNYRILPLLPHFQSVSDPKL